MLFGSLGIWLPGVPGFLGEPTLLNQTTISPNDTELSLRTSGYWLPMQASDPKSYQEVNGNYSLIAAFATFPGTKITFCSASTESFVADDGSFTETVTFSVTSLQRA